MQAEYDRIGGNYSVTRSTDPEIARQLYAELRGATGILNIGAGTGSYEPGSAALIAVEPSGKMISQRRVASYPVVQAVAENLPFRDRCCSHVMTVLSMHHWSNRRLAFNEVNRVATDKFVAITWDPQAEPFWLTRDYFPEIYNIDQRIFPGLEEFSAHFDEVRTRTLPIPGDCRDGFLAAFWKRPEAYLSSRVRDAISSFAKLDGLSEGLRKLEADLDSGAWARKNRAILDAPSLDVGYRIVSARVRSA